MNLLVDNGPSATNAHRRLPNRTRHTQMEEEENCILFVRGLGLERWSGNFLYNALNHWVNKMYALASKCDECGRPRRLDKFCRWLLLFWPLRTNVLAIETCPHGKGFLMYLFRENVISFGFACHQWLNERRNSFPFFNDGLEPWSTLEINDMRLRFASSSLEDEERNLLVHRSCLMCVGDV